MLDIIRQAKLFFIPKKELGKTRFLQNTPKASAYFSYLVGRGRGGLI